MMPPKGEVGIYVIFDIKIPITQNSQERFCPMYDTDGLREIKTKREIFHLNYLLYCKV